MDIAVLFLDIDGVLNPDRASFPNLFAPDCVAQLRRVLTAHPHLRLVLSTSWRFGKTRLELLDYWQAHELPVDRIIGDTPYVQHDLRGEEILQWLDDAPEMHPDIEVHRYAVLDDEPAILHGLDQDVVFICHPWHGLTESLADRLIEHFRKSSTTGRTGPAHPRHARRGADAAALTDHHHNVYVALLNPAVSQLRWVRAANPARDPAKPCVYVGMTGLSPEERFANHKAGLKSAAVVRKFGVRLLPELYAHLNPMPFAAAVQMEQDLAEDLRRAGYTVTSGH